MDKMGTGPGDGQDVEQARPDSSVWEEEIQMKGTTATRNMVVPPPPPPKDTEEVMPALTRPPSALHPNISSRPSTGRSDTAKAPKPLSFRAPLAMNPPTRPGTANTDKSRVEFAQTSQTLSAGSTKRLSWSSFATAKRPAKYGKGKFSHVELNPQPSDDPEDPLNWPQWRKELNLGALLVMVSMTGVMKTIFVSVNHLLAEDYKVSYTSAAALTGVPLMVSALTGLGSLMAARMWGKRPLYLGSLLLLFVGATWNTNVATSYGQCMAARLLQGMGWGAFDTLVMSSIHDTYFEHERCRRVAIYSIVSVATTWGPPLLGGLVSRSPAGFSMQFAILCIFFVLAIPLMALGAPETAFDRAYNMAQTPVTGAGHVKSLPLAPPRTRFSLEYLQDYIAKLKPVVYVPSPRDAPRLSQVPRAFVAPTTLLLFLVSFLPSVALWGLASSLSLLFSPLPFDLTTTGLGLLPTGAFLLATATTALFALWPKWHTGFTATRSNAVAVAAGSALTFAALLALGLHLASCMIPAPASTSTSTSTQTSDSDADAANASIFALHSPGSAKVSLPVVSLLLGLLAAGLAVLDAGARLPLIRRSTAFTSAHVGVALRNTADMDAGVGAWRALAAGVAVVALPDAVWSWRGLERACLGLGTAQVVVGAAVVAVWWAWDEGVRRADGRVMRLVDLEMVRRMGSFFDAD